MNIGIDLGTTHSLVSYINSQGIPSLFPDRFDANLFQTASRVSIHENLAWVGHAAEEAGEETPEMPDARFMKLYLGDSESVWTDSQGQAWPVTALLGLVIRKLLLDAEISSHEQIESSVIAVPPQFNEAKRKVVLDAASIAGMHNASIIDESTAAAMYYAARLKGEQTVLVYDLGGGFFDATVLKISPNGIYVLATSGLPDLGGKIFDQRIKDMLLDLVKDEGVAQAATEAACDPSLWRIAEELKTKIGYAANGRISKSLFIGRFPLEFILTRRLFEDMIRPDIKKTIQTCRECLEAASLGWDKIDRILLVGGSSLIPLVQAHIREESGKPADRILIEQPLYAVVYGAALYANQLAGKNTDTPLLKQGCASQSLGFMVKDPKTGQILFSPLIHRNSPLPVSAKRTFFTSHANQHRLILELAQAESVNAPPKSLGHFIFGGIKNPRKNYPVEVTLDYNVDGTIVARAYDQVTGQEMEHTVANPAETGQADILKWRDRVTKMVINE